MITEILERIKNGVETKENTKYRRSTPPLVSPIGSYLAGVALLPPTQEQCISKRPNLSIDSASQYKDETPNGTVAVRFMLVFEGENKIPPQYVDVTGSYVTHIFANMREFNSWYTPKRKETHRLDYPGAEQFIGFDPKKYFK